MTKFRFSLARVLELRRAQLEMEQVQLQQKTAARAEADRRQGDLEAAGTDAECEIRRRDLLTGGDLEALGAYRLLVRQQIKEASARRAECEKDLDLQRAARMEAHRRVRLLERLQERRYAEWRAAEDKELDAAAAESYLNAIGRKARC